MGYLVIIDHVVPVAAAASGAEQLKLSGAEVAPGRLCSGHPEAGPVSPYGHYPLSKLIGV